MAEQSRELSGPDFTAGIPLADLNEGERLLGHAGGEPVLLVRRGDEVMAVGAVCTHYGGPLAEGMVVGETVRCPWHHACFSLRTGEALGGPAMNPLARWRVEVRDGVTYVVEKEEHAPLDARGRAAAGPESVVIVGAGAAGSAAAEMLRRLGYAGPVMVVDADGAQPYDRPNLSKDYLAGNAPEEWIPLRPERFYGDHGIDRVTVRAEQLDASARELALSDGRTLRYGALLLATGATPVRLRLPGADAEHVHVLRTLDDCRAIIAAAESGGRAVVLGASFIGMEVAASLRARGVEVTVVAPESVPFERTLGRELGGFLKSLHEEQGVRFRLGHTADEIGRGRVRLDDGAEVDADFVVVGVGVRPDASLAESAGLEVSDGIVVDEYLRTSAAGVFAAGDVARYPDPHTGERIRVEHWVVAQRQGQAAARNILGQDRPFTDAPFFWTQHYEVPVAYSGHAADWDRTEVEGDVAGRDCAVRFLRGGRTLALATIYRDRWSLEFEAALEAAARGSALAPATGASAGGES